MWKYENRFGRFLARFHLEIECGKMGCRWLIVKFKDEIWSEFRYVLVCSRLRPGAFVGRAKKSKKVMNRNVLSDCKGAVGDVAVMSGKVEIFFLFGGRKCVFSIW